MVGWSGLFLVIIYLLYMVPKSLTHIASPYRIYFPWVLLNPRPVPVKTRTHMCGCGFAWEQVQVGLENPRVSHAIP